MDQMLSPLIEKGAMTIRYRVIRPDGEVRWLEDKTAVARDAEGRPVRFDGVASDITEREAREAHLLHLATYDPLTDLPNCNVLSDRITQDMAHAQRDGRTVSVLVLGLDRFKLINDSYGHGFGDELLRALATRLRSSFRAGDTVARLRGDEFAVLLSPLKNPKETIPAVRRLLDIFPTHSTYSTSSYTLPPTSVLPFFLQTVGTRRCFLRTPVPLCAGPSR